MNWVTCDNCYLSSSHGWLTWEWIVRVTKPMCLVGSVKCPEEQLPNFRDLTQYRLISHSSNTSVQVFDGDLKTQLLPSVTTLHPRASLFSPRSLHLAGSEKSRERAIWGDHAGAFRGQAGSGEYHSHSHLANPPYVIEGKKDFQATLSQVGEWNIFDENLANFFLLWSVP